MKESLDLLALGLATAIAFLLSGMEAGVFALSRFRIRRLARQGESGAARLQRYLDHPESFLWTILVGHSLATFAVVALTMRRLQPLLEARPFLFMVALVAVLLAFHLFADLLPKILFRRFPNRLTLLGIIPFRTLHVVLSPVVGATERVSRHLLRLTGGQAFTGRLFGSRAELRQVIEESAHSLSREELVMINRILDLQNLRVRDVMTPIQRAACLGDGQSVAELLALVRQRRVSSVPLWKESQGRRRIHGVIALDDALFDPAMTPDRPLSSLVRPAVFVDEGMRLEDALRTLRRGRQRLAVVLNASRREAGVVTLNDILRAMFGEVGI